MMWSKMRRRGVVVGLMLLSMMAVRGVSCSFEEDTAFVSPMEPENLPQFFAGKLDVIQQTYWKKHLAVAYRSLNGKPLSAAEQAEAARPDFVGVEPDYCCGHAKPPGVQYWEKARRRGHQRCGVNDRWRWATSPAWCREKTGRSSATAWTMPT